ncbi:hypothetical protein AQ505_08430 [Pedobacter sp. PACM 27299]|nr:hypothetical protein AQ505_08430 [Pedobacter sp. PACM 27299]
MSCSRYVYQVTKKEGLYQGLIALKYRFHNCRNGFNVFEDALDGSIFMVLPDASILREGEISKRFIPIHKCFKT